LRINNNGDKTALSVRLRHRLRVIIGRKNNNKCQVKSKLCNIMLLNLW